jgi:hypothetical protein
MNGKNFRTRILFSVLSVRSSYRLDRKNEKVFHVQRFFSIHIFVFILKRAQRDLSIPVKTKNKNFLT